MRNRKAILAALLLRRYSRQTEVVLAVPVIRAVPGWRKTGIPSAEDEADECV